MGALVSRSVLEGFVAIVGKGFIDNVPPAVWRYEHSGKQVLTRWFSYRKKDRQRRMALPSPTIVLPYVYVFPSSNRNWSRGRCMSG